MNIATRTAKLLLAGTAILILLGSAAWAEDQKGQVTKVNRLNNTIAVRPIQDGTVGANTAGAEQEFRVKDGVSLEELHAGNRITYTVTDSGGAKTVTGFKKDQ
jgi:Cu/Ag efflux protein CusF